MLSTKIWLATFLAPFEAVRRGFRHGESGRGRSRRQDCCCSNPPQWPKQRHMGSLFTERAGPPSLTSFAAPVALAKS